VSGTQLAAYALAVAPTVLAVLIGILINSRLSDLRAHVDARFNDVGGRFGDINTRFNEVNRYFDDVNRHFDDVNRRFDEMDRKMDQRFEDMKSTWRSELHRVEEVLDARLKHLEER
jgi:hypothetical protein